MRCAKVTVMLTAFMLAGCECDDPLQRACPVPEPCSVPEGEENIEENLLLGDLALERVRTLGECRLGETACDENMKLYCDGYVLPTEETCDFADNDCDGETDEGFDRDNDGYTRCNGDCNDNNKDIRPNRSEECNGIDDNCDGVIPESETNDIDGDGVIACEDCNDLNSNQAPGSTEICDEIDNDCDGEIDENVSEERYSCGPPTEQGACQRGENVCVDGELYCLGAVYESGEVCDNLDNDCDGYTDEDLVQECFSECGIGVEYCAAGNWIGCTTPQPTLEICDGFDNDCDGEIDEGCSCETGTLELCAGGTVDPDTFELLDCGLGIKECDENGEWGPCVFVSETEETCNNYDDDCDGIIDGLQETCSAGGEEYPILGECSLGTSTCTAGVWGECEGAMAPLEEVCNDLDDDCDGEIDENLNSHEKVDMVFAIDGSGSMCQYVVALAQGIGQYVTDFENTDHRFGLVIFPFENNTFDPDIPWIVITDLVDVNTFVAILNSVACNYPAGEPSYDTMYDLADSVNPMGIGWRGDAYPYLIMMTDEPAQTWAGYTENDVAVQTNNCAVGECVAGDKFEVFVFTLPGFFPNWDEVVFFENNRLISLQPVDDNEYANKLRGVFTNVCL